LNVWTVILFYGSFQGIVLGLTLLWKCWGRDSSHLVLALILIVLSIRMFEYALAGSGAYEVYPQIIYFSVPLLTLVGPLFYLYLAKSFSLNFQFYGVRLFHFLPFVIIVVLMIPFYTATGQYKLAYNANWNLMVSMDLTHIIYMITITVQLVVYSILIVKEIKRVSNEKNQPLLKRIKFIKPVVVVLGIHLLIVVVTNLSLLLDKYYFLLLERGSFFMLSGVIQGGIIYGLIHSSGFVLNSTSNKKYKSSPLTKTKMKELFFSIQSLMNQEKIYLNPNLRMDNVSKKLNIPLPYISQVLNQFENLTFSDYTNKHRIEYAKSLLLKPEYGKYTIAGIAEYSGFNNKNTFNRAFKKFTGITPSNYVNRHKP